MHMTRRAPEALAGLECFPADYNDKESLARACAGLDGVMFTSATFTEVSKSIEQAYNVGIAARDAGVGRLVYNTTSWHPEEKIGVPSMDRIFGNTDALRRSGVKLTVIRPSLFMDNLLTRWVKPFLFRDGEFSYPHNTDLKVSWICLDDVARFMIAAMERPDLEGATIDVGGPEALMPGQVAEMLGEVLGRKIVYRLITPREFGERMYDIFGAVSAQTREEYVAALEKHYLYKNDTNPFLVDNARTMAVLPIAQTRMRDWLAQQDWSEEADEGIGSVSG